MGANGEILGSHGFANILLLDSLTTSGEEGERVFSHDDTEARRLYELIQDQRSGVVLVNQALENFRRNGNESNLEIAVKPFSALETLRTGLNTYLNLPEAEREDFVAALLA